MELRMLGPVQLWADGQPVDLGPTKQRTVLAALMVDAGRTVPTETLIDRVWDDDPPAGARSGLYSYITRLRRALAQVNTADGEPLRLVRRTGGYLLDVNGESLDLLRFRRLVDQAGRDDDDVRRAEILGAATGLWRGEPLADLTGLWIERVRQTLSQQHLEAVLSEAQTQLRLGRAAAVIGPLRELLVRHPLVEPLFAALMQALYRSGRGAEALDCYAKARQRLADELGSEPGPELRQLHQMILRGDAMSPDAVSTTGQERQPPAGGAPATAGMGPAQLPPDLAGFTGRADHLRHLDALLPATAAVVISAVSGTAGVGKTALAVHWAHRAAERFPDGQLYVNLRGFDPTGSVMDPAEAVRGFLYALGVPPGSIPPDLDAQTALYRSHLAGRRVLVVLDNARDAEQVRPLLPGAPGCLALVTSRNQLTSLVAADGAHPLSLDLLTPDEARELLVRRLGADRVANEPDAAEEIVTRCARLPLALAIVAARAAAYPRFPLHALARELRDTHGGLDALAGGDAASDVRTVFSWSYRTLTPDAATLFRLLGLYPGPDISAAAAASLAGLPPPRVRPLLTELTRAQLVIERAPARYAFHDLLRAYATEQAHLGDPDDLRRAATHRILDHYLRTAYAAAMLLDPSSDTITLAPLAPGVRPESPADHGGALAWFTTEHPVLVAAIDRAAGAGFDTHTWQLAWTINKFLDRRGLWREQASTQHAALAAAQRLADLPGQAHSHRVLARGYAQQGGHDDADSHLRYALDLYGQLGDKVGLAHTHYGLSWVRDRQARYVDALDHARQALELYRAVDHRARQANALNAVGWCHTRLGDHQQAVDPCQQALALHQELGDRHGAAGTWDSLGHIHHHLGQHDRAVGCYQQAVDLLRELGDRYNEADTLSRLGDTHHATGDRVAARDAWQRALVVLDELAHADVELLRAKLHRLDQTG